MTVIYWREGNKEVDFILQQGEKTVSIEVKTGARQESLPGMASFAKQFKPVRQLLVGDHGIAIEEFLSYPAGYWV
jgi:predicted AAA+ superfamily ATPase